MSLEHRIRQLETQQESERSKLPEVVIYQPGQEPETSDDGLVRIFLPDNGRGPVKENHVE